MFGEKAFELIKELKRSADGNLPAYNASSILLLFGLQYQKLIISLRLQGTFKWSSTS